MKKYEYNYGKNPEGILSTISGYATETTNFGETAFGILNKSTRDKSNFTTPEVVSSSTATLFSVGNGTDHNSRKNIIELKADGSTFINGVGGYDGTNSDSATSLSDTLQNISSGIEGDYLPLTGGTLTGSLTGTSISADAFGIGAISIFGDQNLRVVNITNNDTYLSLQDSNNNIVAIGYNGVTLPNKSSSDLLNAAGSTTSVSDIATQVQAAIVDQAPETLDTLNELAAALGDDPNFATTITNQIAQKADKTVATSSTDGLMSASDKTKLDQITITEGDIVASGFRITDGIANEVLTADGDSNTLKTINGQTLLGSGDVDMSEFATQGDITNINQTIEGLGDTYATKEELDKYVTINGSQIITGLKTFKPETDGFMARISGLTYNETPAFTFGAGVNNYIEFQDNSGFSFKVAELSDRSIVHLAITESGFGFDSHEYDTYENYVLDRENYFSSTGIKLKDKTTSDLLNAGGSTISIDDLKTQVAPDLSSYATKSEVNTKINGIGVSSIQVVTTLPEVQEEGVLYIVTGEEA